MVSQSRANRIAQRIKEELSEIILFEATDPRLEGIFITDVRVDREIAFASIFVSAIEGEERAKDILDGLTHAAGFLRSALAKRIEIRSFPRLRFNWDPTPEHAERIERLLDSIKDDQTSENSEDDE